jgi:hypothetical protein
MLNTSELPGSKAHNVVSRTEGQYLVFRTTMDLPEGAELLGEYGGEEEDGPLERLLNYGIVPPIGDVTSGPNPFDQVIIRLPLPNDDDPARDKKYITYKSLKYSDMRVPMFGSRGLSPELLAGARVAAATGEELDSLRGRLRDVFNAKPVSEQNELKALNLLGTIATEQLARYPTTLIEDIELIRKARETGEEVPKGLAFRFAEKRLLAALRNEAERRHTAFSAKIKEKEDI